jgi:DNA-directed RNA polymerase subunit RPC12/RpoP
MVFTDEEKEVESMITYKCPKCGKTLQSPESEAGDTLDCPECGNVNRVPMLVRPRSALPVWFLVIILILCGGFGCIVVSLVAITALGTSANATFGTVGNKPPPKTVAPAVEKAKPKQPIEKDDGNN